MGLFTLAACSDGPSAPQSLDRDAVALVMPSVTDARVRLARRIVDDVMRERMIRDLQELEMALAGNYVHKARVHVDMIGRALADYRAGASGALLQDSPDVSAIELMLHAVTPVVYNTISYETPFRASS